MEYTFGKGVDSLAEARRLPCSPTPSTGLMMWVMFVYFGTHGSNK